MSSNPVTSLNITCESSSPIKSFNSPTHLINVLDKGANNHLIALCDRQELDKTFILNIVYYSLLDNLAWISNEPGSPSLNA